MNNKTVIEFGFRIIYKEYFMESALYGIYARVVDVSEIERVSAKNE